MPRKRNFTSRWRFHQALMEEIRFRFYGGIGVLVFMAVYMAAVILISSLEG